MMRRIISSTEDDVTAMTEKIKSMKVTSFKGEDISQVTGQLKMAIKRLEVLKKFPDDLEANILYSLDNIVARVQLLLQATWGYLEADPRLQDAI